MYKRKAKYLISTLILFFLSCNSTKVNNYISEKKNYRYKELYNKFIDIKNVQLAYYYFNQKYSNDFDELISFVNTEKFPILTIKDTLVNQKIILQKDTLNYIKVSDSLFGSSKRYLNLGIILIDGKKIPFELTLENKSNNHSQRHQTFEIKIKKEYILSGTNYKRLKKEKSDSDYIYYSKMREVEPHFD